MPKSYKVVISAEAERNIGEAYLWIAESDEDAADRWYEGLIEALKGLARLPLRCPIAPETRLGLLDQKIRQLLYGRNYWKYRILFSVEGDRVLIAHVRHGARLYLGQEEQEDSN
jgi:plasmid stabilization system protein ParE